MQSSSPNPNASGELEQTRDRLFSTGPGAVAREAVYFDRISGTPVGEVYVALNSRGEVLALEFQVEKGDFIGHLEKTFSRPVVQDPKITGRATRAIREYFQGRRKTLDLPVNISRLTPFQQQVLRATRQIPRGQVATYGEIARKIGNPNAVRAVGGALGRNPIPIVIPCHRVIASNGKLGGYSGEGGLATKRQLLVLEGALPA